MKRLLLLIAAVLVPLVLVLLAVVVYVGAGVAAGGKNATGVLAGTGVGAPVTIARDGRGIPHVRAQNERDAFFAEGYLQGSDRLFQIDIYRRAVGGKLSEVFGSKALAADVEARAYDPVGLAEAQLRKLRPQLRDDLAAFAEGVNYAMRTRPLAPEFRLLGYHPEPWSARDSLLTANATVLTLADRWYDVSVRIAIRESYGADVEAAFFPLSDPKYDAPVAGTKAAHGTPLPNLRGVMQSASCCHPERRREAPNSKDEAATGREGLGSNNFAAGGDLTATRRALLANDPHLDLRMPGVWYLVDLAAPGMHVAGATLAGVPGVILGHNEHVAWGATNATIASTALYRETFDPSSATYLVGKTWLKATRRTERFNVRFGKTETRDYLSTRHGFIYGTTSPRPYAVAWTGERDKRAGFEFFFGLSKAKNVAGALIALHGYPGPAQNFVFADDAGNAAYAMGGGTWLDDAWGLKAHDGPRDPAALRVVPFEQMPKVAPSRRALVFSANNQTYGAGYPYRLSSNFAPPYRAARIAQRLHATKNYDVAAFSSIQADVTSLPERDLARAAAAALAAKETTRDPELAAMALALKDFDGRFTPDSKGAAYATFLRRAACERLIRIHLGPELAPAYLDGNYGTALELVLRTLRERPHGWVPNDDYDQFLVASARDAFATMKRLKKVDVTWGDLGARIAHHPVFAFGISLWDGTRFPGNGSGYSPRVQSGGVTQSFRAVWDVGNWDAGGISIPQGESGQPGSPHYRDGAAAWIAGTLQPLPFSDRAISAATESTLELRP